MIEIRLFASLREGREKVYKLEEAFSNGEEILDYFQIKSEDVAIFLINGMHSNLKNPIKDEDVIAIFPPIGGG